MQFPRPLVVAILMAATVLPGCSLLGALNALIPTDAYTKQSDIAYGKLPRQKLDIYMPTKPVNGTAPSPTIVFFYGGRWSDGRRQDYLFSAEALASRGWVAVVADYRLYPEIRYPAFMEDAADAVSWAHAHIGEYGGDPKKIFLMGHSAGAYIAVNLAADPQYLKARNLSPSDISGVIGLAGPYDFLPFTDADVIDIFGPASQWPATQPINHITGHEPPMLLVHGRDDITVKPRNSESLARRIKEKGGQAELLLYPGYDHVKLVKVLAAPFRKGEPLLDDIARFVNGSSQQASAPARQTMAASPQGALAQ